MLTTSVTGAFVLVSSDGFNTSQFPAVSGVEMKIYKQSLQALLSHLLHLCLLSRECDPHVTSCDSPKWRACPRTI